MKALIFTAALLLSFLAGVSLANKWAGDAGRECIRVAENLETRMAFHRRITRLNLEMWEAIAPVSVVRRVNSTEGR